MSNIENLKIELERKESLIVQYQIDAKRAKKDQFKKELKGLTKELKKSNDDAALAQWQYQYALQLMREEEKKVKTLRRQNKELRILNNSNEMAELKRENKRLVSRIKNFAKMLEVA